MENYQSLFSFSEFLGLWPSIPLYPGPEDQKLLVHRGLQLHP